MERFKPCPKCGRMKCALRTCPKPCGARPRAADVRAFNLEMEAEYGRTQKAERQQEQKLPKLQPQPTTQPHQ